MFLTTYVTSWFKRAWCKKAVNSARQVERIQHFTHLLADPNREAERGEVYLSQCFRHAPWTIRVRRSRRKNRSAGCGFLSPWELDTKNFKKVQKGIPCVVAIASFWVVLVASFVWYFLVICIHWPLSWLMEPFDSGSNWGFPDFAGGSPVVTMAF